MNRLRLQPMRNANSINNRYLLTQYRYLLFRQISTDNHIHSRLSLYEGPQGLLFNILQIGPMTASFVNEWNISIATGVQGIAKEINKTHSQIALNWIRQQQQQRQHAGKETWGVILPIIRAWTEAQINDNLSCLDLS